MSFATARRGNIFRNFFPAPWSRIQKLATNWLKSDLHYLNDLEWEAIVDEAIYPGKVGRVSFQGSWWPARCVHEITLVAGETVRVVGNINITLLVEPGEGVKTLRFLSRRSPDGV